MKRGAGSNASTTAASVARRARISVGMRKSEVDACARPTLQFDDEIFKEQITYCLPYLSSGMYATVLEDTVTTLRILDECNNEMRISKTMVDMPLLLALKFGVEQPVSVDELSNIDPKQLGCNEYKLNKLESDRKFINSVMTATYVDLSTCMNYRPLQEHVDRLLSRDSVMKALMEDEAKNRVLARELYRQLRQQRNHNKTAEYDCDIIMDTLEKQVEDAGLTSETEGRYVDNWQNARTEQHHETIREKEGVSIDSIESYKTRSEHEQRVHAEVELLTGIIIDETLKKIEDWMTKFDEDMEAIDLKIQIQKNEYQIMLEKRQHLERTIRKHDKEMREWNDFKEARRKANEYHENMTRSAIVVQAWWRGLLVRKQLGPFRPPKKKPWGKKK